MDLINNWMKLSIAPALGATGIRLLGKTMRWWVVGSEAIDAFYRENGRGIIAFWHGQQLMMPLAYRGNGASILISQHRDGEIIARIMNRFQFQAVRGSTTRGGSRALRKLLQVCQEGRDLVMTPDGPKGPARKVQLGVMYVAKMTGRPILPLVYACSKKKSSPAGTNSKFRFLVQRGFLSGPPLFGLERI